jgi:hypothetical protein
MFNCFLFQVSEQSCELPSLMLTLNHDRTFPVSTYESHSEQHLGLHIHELKMLWHFNCLIII